MTRKEKNLTAVIDALSYFQKTLIATKESINKPHSKIQKEVAIGGVDIIIKELQRFKNSILK